MTKSELLRTTKHRPWPVPIEQWKYYQEWSKSIFLHWQVDKENLKGFVPAELELDSFQGATWVSLVAFSMENIRPRFLPSFPPISNFHEVNIRTYVRSKNKTGVYFLSIEAGKRLSTWISRTVSALPYRYTNIQRAPNNFHAFNTEYGDKLSIDFQTLGPLNDKSELDKWLTERYALFQDTDEGINKFEIHHKEWPIKAIRINSLTCDYPRFSRLLNSKPHLAHWSSGVSVIAWDKSKIKNDSH